MSSLRLLFAGGVLISVVVLAGCVTPQHTNTLIFGTSTKFALDVSQDPTGVVGVTLGYKRQEAVWMPLLANVQAGEKAVPPAECADSKSSEVVDKNGGKATTNFSGCKFSGKAGKGGPNGEGAEDTYSVLATFSGEAKGVAGPAADKPSASAGGSLAQFFATGLAARLLAEQGSSVVNTNGGSKQSGSGVPKSSDLIRQQVSEEDSHVDRVIFGVTDKDGVINRQQLNDLMKKAQIDSGDYAPLVKGKKTQDKLRDFLRDHYREVTKPLFDAL